MKKYLFLTILMIFAVPLSGIFYSRGQSVWYGQYLGLLFFLFLGVSFVLWRFNKYLSIFSAMCLLSTFFVTGLSPRAITLLFQLNMGCLGAYGISKFNKNHRRYILYALLVIILMQYSLLILQAYNADPFFDSLINPGKDELVGFSASADQIGTFFALTLPVMLYFFPPLAFLSLAGIALSKSSFAFVAGIGAGFFYLWFVNRKIFKVALVIVLLFGLLFFLKIERVSMADFDIRFAVWKYATKVALAGEVQICHNGIIKEIVTNPWFGFGYSNFMRIFPFILQGQEDEVFFNAPDEIFTHAHNDYVEIFVFELGKLGILILIMLLGNLVYKFLKLVKTKEAVLYSSCILAYLINATGNFLSQIAISGMLLMLSFGMFSGVEREQIASKNI